MKGKKFVVLFAVAVFVISSAVILTPANVIGEELIGTACTVTGDGTLPAGDEFSGQATTDGTTSTGTWEHWTPAVDTFGGCEDQSGAAYGLCNAYCEAMQCGSDNQQASDNACDKVYNNYVKISGETPPCEPTRNHFVGSAEEVFCFINGGNLGDVRGPGTWNGQSGYSFSLAVQDSVFGDSYRFSVWDSDGNPVYQTAEHPNSGDIVVLPIE